MFFCFHIQTPGSEKNTKPQTGEGKKKNQGSFLIKASKFLKECFYVIMAMFFFHLTMKGIFKRLFIDFSQVTFHKLLRCYSAQQLSIVSRRRRLGRSGVG